MPCRTRAMPHTGTARLVERRSAFEVPPSREATNGRYKPPGPIRGMFASEYYGLVVYGFPKPNKSNAPPICTITGDTQSVNGIASDSKGNLIVPGWT